MSGAVRMPARDAIAVVHGARGERDIVVTTMTPARDWMTLPQHALDMVLVPSAMGHATSMGLGLALAQPDRVERLVLFNTWMWSIADDPAIARGARVAGSWAGRLLYRHLNFPVKALMPKVVGDRRVLTPEIVRHYAAPLASPDERMGAWACAHALLDAGPWYDWLWSQRGRLRGKPMLLLWGMKDPTFGVRYLERWRTEFPDAQVHTFPASGHFVPEEAAAEAGPLLERFVASRADRPATAAV